MPNALTCMQHYPEGCSGQLFIQKWLRAIETAETAIYNKCYLFRYVNLNVDLKSDRWKGWYTASRRARPSSITFHQRSMAAKARGTKLANLLIDQPKIPSFFGSNLT